MEQNTLHKQTAKMIAVIVGNMPDLTEARMQFLIEHPSLLKQKLWTGLMYDFTKEQELFLNTPLNYHILEMNEPNTHDLSVRIFRICEKFSVKTLNELLFTSRKNPTGKYGNFYKALGRNATEELEDAFKKHGLTLP